MASMLWLYYLVYVSHPRKRTGQIFQFCMQRQSVIRYSKVSLNFLRTVIVSKRYQETQTTKLIINLLDLIIIINE